MSLEQWLSGQSPTPNPFCFDCAFLPEPHKLCLIHSLQQQKCDLVLEDGGRSGKGVEKEEKEEAGPQPILHSTPQAGELQLNCFKTPDPELLSPGPKSVSDDEVPLALAWSTSMATPPLQCSGTVPPPLPVVGRTEERRFLLEANVSVASTDVSTLAHSLLDEDILPRTRHNHLDSKPEDGTPSRGDRGTSPDRRKLVALFNIRGDQLEGEVHSTTSPPFSLLQPSQPEKEDIVRHEEGCQAGTTLMAKLKYCNSSSHSDLASPSPVSHITTSPCMTPLHHEPSMRDSSCVEGMTGSQDLFSSYLEPATSLHMLTPDSPLGTGVGGVNSSLRSHSGTPHEQVENKTPTMVGFEGECDNAAMVLEGVDDVAVEVNLNGQEDHSSTPQVDSSIVYDSPVHASVNREMVVKTGGATCEGRPMKDSDTIHCPGQASALRITRSLCRMQTDIPIPVRSSPVARPAAEKRTCKKRTAFLYPFNHQQASIKRNAVADSKDDPSTVTSRMYAQSVLASEKNSTSIEIPVERSHMFQRHRLPSSKEGHGGVLVVGQENVCGNFCSDSPSESLNKARESVLQVTKEFPVTSNSSVPPTTALHVADAGLEHDVAHLSGEKEERFCQDSVSQVVDDPSAGASHMTSPVPKELGSKVPASKGAVLMPSSELQMSVDVAGKADRNAIVCKVLPPARRRKRPSRNRWSRRKKKHKHSAEDCDKERAVCVDNSERSELGPYELSRKTVQKLQHTDSIEGTKEVQFIDPGGNVAEESVKIEALAIECRPASTRLDSMEPSSSNDMKSPKHIMPSTVASKVLLEHADNVRHPQKSPTTGKLSLSGKPLSGKKDQELQAHQASVSRGSRVSGFKPPRLASTVPLAEENAARSKILRGFGIPTRPASVTTGAKYLLHSASNQMDTSSKAEGSSNCCSSHGDVEQMQSVDVHVKDSCLGLAFTGFSTAKGSKWTVSNSALDRVRPLLMGEDMAGLSDTGMSSRGSDKVVSGFSTANDHVFPLTVGSPRKTEALVIEAKDGHSQSVAMGSMCTGFSTAGGRKCTVSTNALRKAEKLCDNPSTSDVCDPPAVSAPSCALTGFVKASGRMCSVSANAVQVGQHLCKEVAMEMDGRTDPTITGFSTAGGRTISVSGGAVSRVKHILTDLMTEDVIEVHPVSTSGSKASSTKEEGRVNLNEPYSETTFEGFINADQNFVGTSMDTSLTCDHDVEADLQDLDFETFATFTQMPKQITSRQTTDPASPDRATAANPFATDAQNEVVESHEVTADVAHSTLGDCQKEEEKEDVISSSTDSLERSSCDNLYLDTQVVQQMLESTAISNDGSDDIADGMELREDIASSSFNLTLSLANLQEGFSRVEEDDSVKDDGTAETCLTPHSSNKVLGNIKEAVGTESLNSQLLELEECFSLTQFGMSLNVTDTVEEVQDSATVDHKHAENGAVIDGEGGAVNEVQETVRKEEGEIVIDTKERVVIEEGRMVVDKKVTGMEEGNESALRIEGGVMLEKDGGVLIEEMKVGAMVIDEPDVTEKGRETVEREWVSANEVEVKCANVSQLAEDVPTVVQNDAFSPEALGQPSMNHPTTAMKFPGLQTASGKEVTVSRAALELVRSSSNSTTSLPYTRSCMEESPSATERDRFKESFTSHISQASPILGDKAVCAGLEASNSTCGPISSEAIEHATVHHCVQEGDDAVEADQPAAYFHGLQMVSRKVMSEAPLKAAPEPCASNMQEEDSSGSRNVKSSDHFRGKKVEIAAESPKHVGSSSGGSVGSTALHGFSTAGGKTVTISECALHHVKSRLGDIFVAQGFPGLQTANGTPVEVSDESLAHVRADNSAVCKGNIDSADFQRKDEEDRQVEVAEQRVHTASSGSSVHECSQVPPALLAAGGRMKTVLQEAPRTVQQDRAPQAPPPSSVKTRAQPLQPVTEPSTSHVVPPAREDGVPAVGRYAPRFKPQTSAGIRGTAPKKVAEEDKALLAPTTFQSPQTATFKPSYHSTPEAYFADRHKGLGSTALKPLHSTVMETPTNHQRGQTYGAATTCQKKRFVYSVPLRGRLPTAMEPSCPAQPQPICAREDGITSLPGSKAGLARTSSFNTTPVWPAGLRRTRGHRSSFFASSTPKSACESSLRSTQASYHTTTSFPHKRKGGLRDGDQGTIAVQLDLDESCSNEPSPEATFHYEGVPEKTFPAMELHSPHKPLERCAQQAQTPQGTSKLPPDVLHGEAVGDDDDLTYSQLTEFMDMTQLEQSPTTACHKANNPCPVATVDRQQSLSTSIHQEDQQRTKEAPNPNAVPSSALSSVPGKGNIKDKQRKSSSLLGNATSFIVDEDSGIGTMPTSNSTSIQHASSPATGPSSIAHLESFREECHNGVQQNGIQRGSLDCKKRVGDCQSEPRPSKRRKKDNDKPLNNTFMHMTNVNVVGRGCSIRPHSGMLYSMKRCSGRGRQPLSLLSQGLPPRYHTVDQLLAMGVPSFVLGVSAANAVELRFDGRLFFSASVLDGQGVRVGDGAMLHLGEDGCAGAGELERAFFTTPGVDPRLVPQYWFRNHYHWLIWKLAAMEVCFPQHLAGRCLTPNWLMMQMKYRYDREIDNAHRSALRKVYEHDDTPAKTMVLCVCKINTLSTERMRSAPFRSEGGSTTVDEPDVELTDGWYSVPAVFDSVLRHHLRQGTITIGTKLITCGAELAGSEEPCSPLEAPSCVILKLTANSTRRALWDTKLGFHAHVKPFHISLTSVRADGGKVGCTSFTLARVYPLLYMERKADGSKAFRTKRAEEKAVRASDAKRQKIIEGICERERKQFEKDVQQEDAEPQSLRSKRRLNSKQIMSLDDGEDIYRAMHQVSDPQSFQECLSVTQKTLLLSYKETVDAQRRDELQRRISSAIEEAEEEELPPKRDVVPFLRMKVTDSSSYMGKTPSDAVFCVWRPSEELRQLLKEGCSYRVYSLQASEGRGGLQLTATKFTQYEEVSPTKSGPVATFCPRTVTAIYNLVEGDQEHPYGEVDTVGVVVHVSNTVVTTARGEVTLDNVYLADQDGNMVTIKVWDGLSALGYDDLVRPCVLLSASNLQVQPTSGQSALPSLQAKDVSVFSQSPRDQHLSAALHHLKAALPTSSAHVTFSFLCKELVRMVKVKEFCDNLLEYVHL